MTTWTEGAATGAVTRAGGNTTEATTTSTTAVDLLSVASLSIGATTPFLFVVNGRKTTGAAAAIALGLKLNTTVVGEAVVGNLVLLDSSATNQAENGYSKIIIGSRVTNYLRSGTGHFTVYATANTNSGIAVPINTADIPNATITDVVIRAISGSALVTAGADELQIYALATS